MRLDEFAAMLRYSRLRAERSLRRRRARQYDHFGTNCDDLGVEAWTTRRDLRAVELMMKTHLATRLPFEVFDHVGDVGLRALDAGLDQRPGEQFSRRTDEGLPARSSLSPAVRRPSSPRI